MRFNRSITAFALAAVTVASACSKSSTPDSGLQNDLSLAAQQQQSHLDSVSALEANNAAAANANSLRTSAPAPVRRTTTASAPRRRSSTTSSSTGEVYSGTTVSAPAPAPAPVVVKHTQRDAAIGAAAGAVIGATTSRNKVKGGLIGAAVGGILGGVVGNNVDKTKKPPM